MKTKLSDRVRPNSEAAPWVIDEIKKLEAELPVMKRKVIQIAPLHSGGYPRLWALCDDGTMWVSELYSGDWKKYKSVPEVTYET